MQTQAEVIFTHTEAQFCVKDLEMSEDMPSWGLQDGDHKARIREDYWQWTRQQKRLIMLFLASSLYTII